MTMRNFLLVFSCAAIPLCGNAATVTCGLNDTYGSPSVTFGEVTGDLQIVDFQDKGVVGISVKITGNGNKADFANKLGYTKVGNRIELDSDFLWLQQTTSDEFKSHFGAFPEATCTIP